MDFSTHLYCWKVINFWRVIFCIESDVQIWIQHRRNTMQAIDRLRYLEELFLNGVAHSHGQAFSIETLLDILIVLYDECCSSTLRREKSVSEFVKFGKFCMFFCMFKNKFSWQLHKLHAYYVYNTADHRRNFSGMGDYFSSQVTSSLACTCLWSMYVTSLARSLLHCLILWCFQILSDSNSVWLKINHLHRISHGCHLNRLGKCTDQCLSHLARKVSTSLDTYCGVA